ncbi:MAG: 50S ribosomal protein L6 [Dehalococcoidia bacterium]
MSRVGKQPIPLPSSVKVQIDGSGITVTGPKGELSATFHPDLTTTLEDGVLKVTRPSDGREHRSLHGLTRTLLANMVTGVSEGFRKTLDIVGVGYRAQMDGGTLVLQVGFSHRVEVKPPPDVTVSVEGNNRIHVDGIDKQRVGEMAAQIRAVRPPDRYKGKGVRYTDEVVRLKPGKRAIRTEI